jgi:hypothetical protein
MPTGIARTPPDFIRESLTPGQPTINVSPMGETGRTILPPSKRDFLTGEPPAPAPLDQNGIDPYVLAALHSRLSNIELFLAQNHPSVLLRVEVDGAWNGRAFVLTDTNVHRVSFLSGRERFAAYKLLLFSTYGNASPLWDPFPMAAGNTKDGIPFPTSAPLIVDNMTMEEMYIMVPTLISGTCSVNAPADPTNGGLTIIAWGIPQYHYETQPVVR